jgi:predicted phosphoribosyltransferase
MIGMATGAMMILAARWPNMKQNCRELIIGVPAAPPDTVGRLKQILEHHDKVIVPYSSPSSFRAVAQFYKDFERVTDNEVKLIMKRRGYKIDI